MVRKENRGGSRKNAGAKPKYYEPTKTISFRVPESKIYEVKAVVNELLTTYRQNAP